MSAYIIGPRWGVRMRVGLHGQPDTVRLEIGKEAHAFTPEEVQELVADLLWAAAKCDARATAALA